MSAFITDQLIIVDNEVPEEILVDSSRVVLTFTQGDRLIRNAWPVERAPE